MKKFTTALALFTEKFPNVEIKSIEKVFKNHFTVVTIVGVKYSVDISANSVDRSYDDPDW